MRRPVPAALAALLLLAGCTAGSSSSPAATTLPSATPGPGECDTSHLPGWPSPGQVTTSGAIPAIASSQIVAGATRFLFTAINEQNQPIAAPDLAASLSFYDLCADPATPTETATSVFAWGIEGVRGFYVATPTFAHAGFWGARIAFTDAAGRTSGGMVQFTVRASGSTPAVGLPAPAVRTPVATDVGGDLGRISSDPSPDPAFYTTSVDAALAAGQPFVLVFASPSFCTSGECGPTLEMVKRTLGRTPTITVIHVEPYQLSYANGRLQLVLDANGQLQFVPAAEAWGIPTEPWVFVVGRDGRVLGSFEAVIAPSELTSAVDRALAGG